VKVEGGVIRNCTSMAVVCVYQYGIVEFGLDGMEEVFNEMDWIWHLVIGNCQFALYAS
jgi:hypothetical protein